MSRASWQLKVTYGVILYTTVTVAKLPKLDLLLKVVGFFSLPIILLANEVKVDV